ncbi:MAG: SPASM domain-containing protein [Candidatus Gastranaerophilaceae bacterium]
MKKHKQICLHPFRSIEVYDNGETSCCWCPYLVNKYSYGNIFEQSFEEIWNGEKAKAFRQDVLDGKYTWCDLTMCATDGSLSYYTENPDEVSIESPYPLTVNFALDHSCNLKCIMCRDKIDCNKKEVVEKLDALLDDTFIPMLKNAQLLHPCSLGEVFVSKHAQKLIKMATEKYPNLNFCIYSNGMFCDEEHITKLGLTNKIDRLLISVHASTKETYDKVVRGGDFDRVMKNLEWAAGEQAKGHIGNVTLNYVVSSLNYQDMAEAAKTAKRLNISASFWELRSWESSDMSKNVEPYAIFEESHPEHDKLVEVLKDPIFLSRWVVLNDVIKNSCPKETEKEAKKRIKEEEKYIKEMGFDKHISRPTLDFY